jgi:S-formylglutathione hydrolase FrmB
MKKNQILLFFGLIFLVGCGAHSSSSPPSGTVLSSQSFFSTVMNTNESYSIYLPPDYNSSSSAGYPVVYLLHGYGGDENFYLAEEYGTSLTDFFDNWINKGTIDPMVVVMPDADNSFFTDFHDGTASWETYIVQDLIPYIDSAYNTKANRLYRAVDGFSMGGYGAMKLAMKYPNLFVSASSHSGVLDLLDPTLQTRIPADMLASVAQVFGDINTNEAYYRQNNPCDLASTKAADIKSYKLNIYFDCGDQDEYQFYKDVSALNSALTLNGISYESHIYEGQHDAVFLWLYLDDSLKFHSRNF